MSRSPHRLLVRVASLGGALLLAGGVVLLAPTPQLAGTLLTALVAVVLVARAVRITMVQARSEHQPSGLAYDAVLADVMLSEISRHSAGSALFDLRYQSRQIVFLDDSGSPASAQVTGPGSVTVIAPLSLQLRLRKMLRTRGRGDQAVTIVERGVVTDAGRIVHACLLRPAGGNAIAAEMAACSSFPR
jgi:hypothetical protein